MKQEIITLTQAKELKVRTYEVNVKGNYKLLMENATICLKEEIEPKVLIEGSIYYQLFGKIVFINTRTHIIYDTIVYDEYDKPYIYMVNSDHLDRENFVRVF